MGWEAIPSVFDKLLGRFLPKKAEHLRNKIDKLKEERDEILQKPSTPKSRKRLVHVLNKLREAEQRLKNRA